MKRIAILLTFCLTVLFAAACSREQPVRRTTQLDPKAETSAGAEMPAGHPSNTAPKTPAQVDLSGIEKAEGGVTVGELFAGKAELAGKPVTLRAKVVKFNPRIMGKNWLHVRDGSGDAAAKTNDLTVTTSVTAKVGDTVLISGAVTLDKDFGAGYKYDVIIEDAKVTVE